MIYNLQYYSLHVYITSDQIQHKLFENKSQDVCIDTSCDSGNSTFETYYSNFIAKQLYVQKCLKNKSSQY